MKLTIFKGIAHDLAWNLGFLTHISSTTQLNNLFSDLPIETNVLEKKDKFDNYCLDFFKKRVPKSFDFNRVEYIAISINLSGASISVNIKIKIDGKLFSESVNY